MKKIAPAFAAVALTCAGLVVANGQPQRFFSQSFNQAPVNSCVKAENALGKIVLAQKKFGQLESGTRYFYRAHEVDVTTHEINRLLRESCADMSVLDKSGKATEEEMKSRLGTAVARTKSELAIIRMKNIELSATQVPTVPVRGIDPL